MTKLIVVFPNCATASKKKRYNWIFILISLIDKEKLHMSKVWHYSLPWLRTICLYSEYSMKSVAAPLVWSTWQLLHIRSKRGHAWHQWRTQEFCSWGVQQIQLRTERERGSGGGSLLVRGSGGSCNLVQEISFHIVKFPQFFVYLWWQPIYLSLLM